MGNRGDVSFIKKRIPNSPCLSTKGNTHKNTLSNMFSILIYRILEKKSDEKFTCPELVNTLINMKI